MPSPLRRVPAASPAAGLCGADGPAARLCGADRRAVLLCTGRQRPAHRGHCPAGGDAAARLVGALAEVQLHHRLRGAGAGGRRRGRPGPQGPPDDGHECAQGCGRAAAAVVCASAAGAGPGGRGCRSLRAGQVWPGDRTVRTAAAGGRQRLDRGHHRVRGVAGHGAGRPAGEPGLHGLGRRALARRAAPCTGPGRAAAAVRRGGTAEPGHTRQRRTLPQTQHPSGGADAGLRACAPRPVARRRRRSVHGRDDTVLGRGRGAAVRRAALGRGRAGLHAGPRRVPAGRGRRCV